MSIRDSMPTPDQDAVAAGDTEATDAEIGMESPLGDQGDDERVERDHDGDQDQDQDDEDEEGIAPDTGTP